MEDEVRKSVRWQIVSVLIACVGVSGNGVRSLPLTYLAERGVIRPVSLGSKVMFATNGRSNGAILVGRSQRIG